MTESVISPKQIICVTHGILSVTMHGESQQQSPSWTGADTNHESPQTAMICVRDEVQNHRILVIKIWA